MLLLYGDIVCNTDWLVDEPRTAGYSRIYQVHDGEAWYADSEHNLPLLKDHIYIFPSSEPYSLRHNPDNPLSCTFLHYDFFPIQIRSLINIDKETHPVLQHLFDAIAQSIKEQNPPIIESIAQAAANYCKEKALLDPIELPVTEAVTYIRRNFMQKLNNEELSRLLGYNPQYFIRLFRKHVGLTPHQYLINCRLLEARQLLKTGKSINMIAELCGFPDAKSFGRCFRNTLGVSPSQFRAAKQQP